MSFLNQLKLKKKKLRIVETKVITESGHVFKEIKTADGFKKKNEKNEQTCGFIIDTKPDLSFGNVFKFLYYGSQDVATDINILNSLQITDVLSVGVKVQLHRGFMYKFIEAYDLPTFNMKNIFIECFLYFENIRLQDRRVFVHCNAGISRSPTIIIAYVMNHLNIGLEDAFKFVKETRLIINPNAGFISQLRDYEIYLKNN